MFGLLKNKISNFINSVIKKGEEKDGSPTGGEEGIKKAEPEAVKEGVKTPEGKAKKPAVGVAIREKEAPEEKGTGKKKKEGPILEKAPQGKTRVEEKELKPKEKEEKASGKDKARTQEKIKAPLRADGAIQIKKAGEKGKKARDEPTQATGIAPKRDEPAGVNLASLEKATRGGAKKEVSVTIGSRIRSIFSDEISLSEKDVSNLFDSLELALLEADVAYDVCIEVISSLKKSIIGKKVSKKNLEEEVKNSIREILSKTMTTGREFEMVEKVRSLPKPAKILFVGPNGAGKTTTIAKIAKMLKQNSMTVVFSASDTFRAAAIEQMQVHADNLEIRMIKSKYGSDPAAVAYDAVNYARTNHIDVVLIDSAGRQETNKNLLDELKKIVRVVKPDLKIYIGESFGGNPLIGQISEFDKAIGLDGAILTKLDCDVKGGSAISVAKATNVPVIYVGVGQQYEDLERFLPETVALGILE